jgi:hypothetical protein
MQRMRRTDISMMCCGESQDSAPEVTREDWVPQVRWNGKAEECSNFDVVTWIFHRQFPYSPPECTVLPSSASLSWRIQLYVDL